MRTGRTGRRHRVRHGLVLPLQSEPDRLAADVLAVGAGAGHVGEPGGQVLRYRPEAPVVACADRHAQLTPRCNGCSAEGPRCAGAPWWGRDGDARSAADVVVPPVGVPQRAGEGVRTGRTGRRHRVRHGLVLPLQSKPDPLAADVLAVGAGAGHVGEAGGQHLGYRPEAPVVACADCHAQLTPRRDGCCAERPRCPGAGRRSLDRRGGSGAGCGSGRCRGISLDRHLGSPANRSVSRIEVPHRTGECIGTRRT